MSSRTALINKRNDIVETGLLQNTIERQKSWDNSASGYELDDRGQIPGRGRNFSLRHRVLTGSEAHPAFSQMGTVGTFLRR
jgi:hypothetical protein